MRVPATDLDGHPLGEVDLTRSAEGRAAVNGQPVIAMRPLGSRVVLLLGGDQYCVPTTAYWQVMTSAPSAATERGQQERPPARRS